MNAKKTSRTVQTVKVLGAVLATVFAVLAAGCAADVPSTGNGLPPASPAPTK